MFIGLSFFFTEEQNQIKKCLNFCVHLKNFQKSNENEILKIRWEKHALWWENYRDPRYVLEEWLAIRPDHILTYKFVFKRKSTDNFFANNYFFSVSGKKKDNGYLSHYLKIKLDIFLDAVDFFCSLRSS